MVENIIKKTPFRRETSLAKTKDIVTESRPKLTSDMAMGYITSINHQTNTCSVMLDNNHNNTIGSTNVVPNVPLPVNGYGVNKQGNYYGDYPNIAQGVRVLIGYIGGDTNKPIVLGVYPPQEFIEHLTPTKESLVDDTDLLANDLWSYKKVYPSQQVKLEQGNGDFTRTFNGHSFIGAMKTDSTANQNQYDVNYTGVENKDNNLTRDYYLKAFHNFSDGTEYPVEDLAQDFVLINQSTSTMDNHLTKLMVKSTGELQEIFNNKVIDNKLLKIDAGLFEGYKITNQLDSKGDNPKQYLKFEINDDHLQLSAVDDKDSSVIEITPKGAYLDGDLLVSDHSITQLQKDIKTLEDEVNPIIGDIVDAGGIKGIVSRISNNTSSINTVTGRVTTLENSVNPVLEQISANGGISGIMSKISNNTSSINNVAGRVTTLENEVPALSNSISSLDGRISSNTGSINDIYGRLSGIDNSINGINNNINGINNNIGSINSNISGINGRIGSLDNRITSNTNSINGLSGTVGSNTSKITDTNTKLDNLIQTLKDKHVI